MLSTSSLSRRRFGLGDEAPEMIPRDSPLRPRSDAGVGDHEDASERSPDPPIDRRELVLRVTTRPLASRFARESRGAMDGAGPPSASPRHSPARLRPRQNYRTTSLSAEYLSRFVEYGASKNV